MKLNVPSSFELGADRAVAAGCIAGVLRRILCRSVRGRRCRDVDEEVWTGSEKFPAARVKCEVATASGVSPGIVARLMGLESSAVFPCVQPPEVITRTRSANSVDAWQGPALLGEQRSGNGGSQLRKSQSFHEVPSYLRKESEEFLVLTFGDYDEGEAKDMDLGVGQYNTKENRGDRKLMENQRPVTKMLENDAHSKQSDAKASVPPMAKENSGYGKGMESNETAVISSCRRKKVSFAPGEMETECISQNSSPVSVFDLPLHADTEHLIVPDSSVSACNVSMGKLDVEESGKKISSEVEDERLKLRKNEEETQDLSDAWAQICRLGEEDLLKSGWITKKMAKSEEAEELGFVIGHVVLDLLLREAVIDMSN